MKILKNVNEYISNSDKAHQIKLKEIRKIVKDVAQEAVEGIAYGMPAYKYNDKPLFYFAAMKGHLGLYPTSGPIKEYKSILTKFSTSKGCIRVPYDMAIPKSLIIKLIKWRMKEIKSSK